MAEYIEREAAIDAVTEVYYNTPDVNLSAEKFEAAINSIPAADVTPVVHGRWIDGHCIDYDKYIKCSKCCAMVRLDSFFNDIGDWNYCPNCGARCDLDCRARMDGDN